MDVGWGCDCCATAEVPFVPALPVMGFGSMGVSCVAGGCVVEGDGAAGLDDDCLGRIGVVSAIAGRGTTCCCCPFSTRIHTRRRQAVLRNLSTLPVYVTTRLLLLLLSIARSYATHWQLGKERERRKHTSLLLCSDRFSQLGWDEGRTLELMRPISLNGCVSSAKMGVVLVDARDTCCIGGWVALAVFPT